MSDYVVSTNIKEMALSMIHRFLSQSYWAAAIPFEMHQKAMKNSLCFGVYAQAGKQVGFARMITDQATFAHMADIFILEAHRGKGLSKVLIEAILKHPDLQGLRRITVTTLDAHGLYEQFGFKALASPQIFMALWNPNVYTSA